MSRASPRSPAKISRPPTSSAIASSSRRRHAHRNGIEQRVHPTMVPKESAIAQVMGVTNAVSLDVVGFPPSLLVGPGAGGAATASAVVADIGDIARGVRCPPFCLPSEKLKSTGRAPMQRHEGGYYIRMLAFDRPGTFAAIAGTLAQEKISLESIVQKHRNQRPHGATIPRARGAGAGDPDYLRHSEDAVRRH